MRFFNFIKRGLILALSFLREIFKEIEKMTQSQSGVQVNNLQTVSTLSNTASILALTDAPNNTVNLIGKNDLSASLVSSTANNGLSNDENGLFVPNIGNLADLDTTDKSSIIDAINENVGNIGQINTTLSMPVTTLATSGTIALSDNSINSITPTASVTFTLPTVTDNTKFHQILVQVNLTNTNYLTASNLGASEYFNASAPAFPQTGFYNIYYEFDILSNAWCVGSVIKGVQA